MPDTIRTKAELLSIFADNSNHAITPQSLRDFVISVRLGAYQVQASNRNPNPGSYLMFVESQDSDDAGYLVIRDATIIAASISRTDVSASIIEIITLSSTTELATAAIATLYDPLTIAVSAGDLVRARVKPGQTAMSNVCLTLLLEEN